MPQIETIGDQIYWSYANLARAHAALSSGTTTYKTIHHVIRSKLFKGLKTGTMSIRSLYDDERLKMTSAQACVYCGSQSFLSLDHLIPKSRDGADEADNLVWACRSCNSSKNKRDMISWMNSKGMFPNIFVLRRYLKIVHIKCSNRGLMDCALHEEQLHNLSFSIADLPIDFPKLESLTLSATIARSDVEQ